MRLGFAAGERRRLRLFDEAANEAYVYADGAYVQAWSSNVGFGDSEDAIPFTGKGELLIKSERYCVEW